MKEDNKNTELENTDKKLHISDVISSKTPTWENILEHYSDYNSGREITPRELDFYEWIKEKYFPPIKK